MIKFIYLISNTYECVKMKYKLPNKFDKVNLKINEQYLKWKINKDIEFDRKVVKYLNGKWWKSIDDNKKKELIKIYKTKEVIFNRRERFSSNILSNKLCKWRIIDKTYFK
jgi:hypothetical protein